MNREQKIAVLAAAARVCPDRLRRAGYLARAHVLIMAAKAGDGKRNCNQYEHDPDCPDYDPSKDTTKQSPNDSPVSQEDIEEINKRVKDSGITDGIEVHGPCSKQELEEAAEAIIEVKKKYPQIPISKLVIETEEETKLSFYGETQDAIDSTGAWVDEMEPTVIHVNGDQKTQGIHNRKGWTDSGTTDTGESYRSYTAGDGSIKDLITHETGHVLHYSRSYDKITVTGSDGKQHKIQVDRYLKNVYNEDMKSATASEKPTSLSGYSADRHDEYFAEMFTAYIKDKDSLSTRRQKVVETVLSIKP